MVSSTRRRLLSKPVAVSKSVAVSSTRAWGAALQRGEQLIETSHCLVAVQSLNMSEVSRSLGTQQSADAVAVVHAPIGY